MTALLGPDLGDGVRRGSPTNTSSLQPLMRLLNARSHKKWKAGHLLNAEFGGSGINDDNLTPLTAAANNAHRVFEGHIVRMLARCRQIDEQNQDYIVWYGVLYTVSVSGARYATFPAANDMHSYARSHLSLDYRFVKIPKFPAAGMGGAPYTAPTPPSVSTAVLLAPADPQLANLQSVVQPNFAASVNVVMWTVGAGGIQFSVEIHNEP
ncbi:hypothetical protein N0A02_28905 [Paraburkholderia acidicola]|uniref:Uncharacterized protein n=1 Tax=Paraburkholderia acidicola TaxID=1912599 RepID=A0ABV1LX31_9BURK